MNWDNITYIFQIPITWYEKIHKRVFGAYGTNFIRVKDGDDGGMQIAVDENSFAQSVMAAIAGQDATINVVTDVIWNGTTLQKKTIPLTFKGGALTTVGIETTTTIDTPVAY